MKIRKSTFWSNIALLSFFSIALLVLGYQFWLQDYITSEQATNREKITSIAGTFEQERNILMVFIKDWGMWDEAYNYVRGDNPQFADLYGQSNDVSLSQIGIDVVALYNDQGKMLTCVMSKVDSRSAQIQNQLSTMFGDNGLWRFPKNAVTAPAQTGVVMCGGTPLMIVSSAVLPTNGKGKYIGRLLAGKIVDQKLIQDIIAKSHVSDVQLKILDSVPPYVNNKNKKMGWINFSPDPDSGIGNGTYYMDTLNHGSLCIEASLINIPDGRAKLLEFSALIVVLVLLLALLHNFVFRRVLYNKLINTESFLHKFDARSIEGKPKLLVMSGDDEITEMAKALNSTITEVSDLHKELIKEIEERLDAVRKLSKERVAAIMALAKLAECRDKDTGEHIMRMAKVSRIIADKLQTYDEYADIVDDIYIETLEVAATLHDIGKVGIQDSILKKEGRYTDDEYERMKMHTSIGSQALLELLTEHPDNSFLRMAWEIAYNHHEKWDGSGYPRGIRGQEIPLAARVVALADVFDALMSERCYKKAYSLQESLVIIRDSAGSHFDPELVEIFLKNFAVVAKVYALDTVES